MHHVEVSDGLRNSARRESRHARATTASPATRRSAEITGLLYLNLRWTQDFFRAGWQKDYEQKLAHTHAELARLDLTAKERRRLERYHDELPNRFHLVTSPDETYRTVNAVGVVFKAAASAQRNFGR